jgi:hypothetical protein
MPIRHLSNDHHYWPMIGVLWVAIQDSVARELSTPTWVCHSSIKPLANVTINSEVIITPGKNVTFEAQIIQVTKI